MATTTTRGRVRIQSRGDTVRTRVELLGADGEPVEELRVVRLTLEADAAHGPAALRATMLTVVQPEVDVEAEAAIVRVPLDEWQSVDALADAFRSGVHHIAEELDFYMGHRYAFDDEGLPPIDPRWWARIRGAIDALTHDAAMRFMDEAQTILFPVGAPDRDA